MTYTTAEKIAAVLLTRETVEEMSELLAMFDSDEMAEIKLASSKINLLSDEEIDNIVEEFFNEQEAAGNVDPIEEVPVNVFQEPDEVLPEQEPIVLSHDEKVDQEADELVQLIKQHKLTPEQEFPKLDFNTSYTSPKTVGEVDFVPTRGLSSKQVPGTSPSFSQTFGQSDPRRAISKPESNRVGTIIPRKVKI